MISLAPGETNFIGSRPLTQAEADALYFPIDGDLGQANFGLNLGQVQQAINDAIASNQLISIPEADLRYLGIDANFGILLQELETQFQSWLTQQQEQIESIGTGLMTGTLHEIENHRTATSAHSWGQISEKPDFAALYKGISDPIDWGAITNPPLTATRWPSWTEVTSKPSTFPPATHTHDWGAIANPPLTATRWPSWAEVTSKPATFPPETHTHDWSAIANKPTTFPPATHTHSFYDLIDQEDWLTQIEEYRFDERYIKQESTFISSFWTWGTGWGVYSSAAYLFRVRWSGKRIFLEGLVKRSSPTASLINIGTLGVNYRPNSRRLFCQQSSSGIVRVDVDPSGVVSVQSPTFSTSIGWVSLDGISFFLP